MPPEYALEALLHDAAEAYIGDVSTPLKKILGDYTAVEKNVERAVFARFGVMQPLPNCVKIADLIMLATEKRDLMPASSDDWFSGSDIKPMVNKLVPVPPSTAKRMFLSRFNILNERMKSELTELNLAHIDKKESSDVTLAADARRALLACAPLPVDLVNAVVARFDVSFDQALIWLSTADFESLNQEVGKWPV